MHANNVILNRTKSPQSVRTLLNNNFKSKDVEPDKFTNFIEGTLCREYKILKSIKSDFKSGIDIKDKYFKEIKLVENGPGQKEKIDRLLRIINRISGEIIIRDAMVGIWKANLKEEYSDNRIRFYFIFRNDNLELLCVDVFHLGILTRGQAEEINRLYLNQKNNSHNICNIK